MELHNHTSFPLVGMGALPLDGTDFNQEIDTEALGFHESRLWLVGLHRLQLNRLKPYLHSWRGKPRQLPAICESPDQERTEEVEVAIEAGVFDCPDF
jgi:hypothetical protein